MGLAQVCATDDIEENKKICLEIIDIAGKKNVQFLFFPEGFYFMGPPDSVYNIYIQKIKPISIKCQFIRDVCNKAREHSMWISLGGFPELLDDRTVSNTQIIINLQGYIVSIYRQIHSFTPYTPGDKLVVVGIDDIKFGLTIGNDLLFPELFSKLCEKGVADVLL